MRICQNTIVLPVNMLKIQIAYICIQLRLLDNLESICKVMNLNNDVQTIQKSTLIHIHNIYIVRKTV